MGVLITTANFIGKFAIPQGSFSDLDSFITDQEESYLNDLLGADLYAAFKDVLTGTPPAPPSAPYLTIYNKFDIDFGSKVYRSKGMVNMLCGFIYFDYMSQLKFKPTSQGIVVNVPDTGKEIVIGNLYQYLNDATETYNAIQTYIKYIKPNLFVSPIPTFNGQGKSTSISIFQ